MKKIKFLFLAALFTVTAICSNAGAVREVTADTAISLNETISSFETLEEYYTFRFGNRFGKVDVNTDKTYVTNGDASMKMEVWGQVHKKGVEGPIMKVALSPNGTVDISRLKSFTFDLFNQTGKTSAVEVAIQIDGTVSEYQKITLANGKNSITAKFDTVGLAVGFDLTKAEYLVFRFAIAPSYEEATEQIYYLDNLQMNMSLVAPDPLEIILDEGEFCSFDKPYQKYVVTVGGVGPTTGCQPLLSINKDAEYCKDAKGKSLRVELPTGIAPLNDGWPYWTFIEALKDEIDWTQLCNSGKKLVFDVYNTGSNFRFGFEVWSSSKKAKGWSIGFDVVPGWSKIEIDLSCLNDNQTDAEGEYPEPLTENISEMVFSYSKFSGEAKVFYFDNFRFE